MSEDLPKEPRYLGGNPYMKLDDCYKYGQDVGECFVIRDTPRALFVRFEQFDNVQHWVPRSVIHKDSEVYRFVHLGSRSKGGKGILIVAPWWARSRRVTRNTQRR